jgi:hypothetical protein
MHNRKPYKCPACGAEVPDLPMTVLKHQMSHISRRPYSRAMPERSAGPSETHDATGSSRDD